MTGYRFDEQQRPPAAEPATDVAITRFAGVYEVEPSLMVEHVTQQTFPNWDTLRIVRSRHDHLAWMHSHWAQEVISGAQLLEEAHRTGTADAPNGKAHSHSQLTAQSEVAPHADHSPGTMP